MSIATENEIFSSYDYVKLKCYGRYLITFNSNLQWQKFFALKFLLLMANVNFDSMDGTLQYTFDLPE